MADFLAVYGSLRRGMQAESKMQRMEFVGTGLIEAGLYALGWYPGIKLKDDGNLTVVEVYKLPEAEQLRKAILWDLDGYEGYNPDHPENSLFIRRVVPMFDTERHERVCLDAVYVYEYNYPFNRAPLIVSGDWNEFRNQTA